MNKKLLTTALTALMLISMLAIVVPAANAVASPPYLIVPTNTPHASTTVARTSGNVGARVEVVGNATAGTASPFSTVTVYWDSLAGPVLGTAAVDNTGAYAVNVTIPSAIGGQHFIVVNEGAGAQGSAFTVTPSITGVSGATTVRVLPGDTITIGGHGFNASMPVNVTFGGQLLAQNVLTNATGSFSTTITIPANASFASVGNPVTGTTTTITATDASLPTPFTASGTVSVGYYVRVSPTSGPPGITTTISGRIMPSVGYTILVDGVQIATGTTSATGAFSNTWTVPALIGAGGHTISVQWINGTTLNSVQGTFTVTAAPTVTLSAASGVAGALVTVTGANFVPNANITLYFGTTVVNSTVTDSRFGPTDADGAFSEQFTVPSLAPGAYTVTVTDQYGASASVVGGFAILPAPVTSIVPRSTTYFPGDILSFRITTSETGIGPITVTVRDPTGQIWWAAGTATGSNAWTLTTAADGTQYIAYQNQTVDTFNQIHMQFPNDAPTGAWNWTITYTPASLGTVQTATGIINVAAANATTVDLTSVTTRLDALNATINNMNTNLLGIGANVTSIRGSVVTIQTDVGTVRTTLQALNATIIGINGNVATLQTSIGTITTSISGLQSSVSSLQSSVSSLSGISGQITSISNNVASIQTTLGSVTTSLQSIDAVLGAVAGQTATLNTSLGTITTSLSSLNTKLTGIEGNVATLQTDLGTLKGTVTSVQGDIATIKTDIGTLQTNVGSLQTTVSGTKTTTETLSPLIIVAIVLALIAAIAAIASIVMMRRKIAG